MSKDSVGAEQLQAYRQKLAAIQPNRSSWNQIRVWAESIKRLIEYDFPQTFLQFQQLIRDPPWQTAPTVLYVGDNKGYPEERKRADDANDRLVADAHAKLLEFVDSLIALVDESKRNSFPAIPKPKLSREEVIRYLLALKTDGHEVYQADGHIFVLVLDQFHRIDFVLNEACATCQVQGKRYSDLQNWHGVETLPQLEQAVASLASSVAGIQWPFSPTSGRLSAATQATNYRTISQLIGSAKVEAVFDPYLENRSLTALVDILSFGSGEVAAGVRLLGSTRMTIGRISRFTKTGVDAWLTQLGINGEARVMAPDDQHRRFILLSGGQSLHLGHSLNAIHKNEATHVESDAPDRVFFDSVWATAAPLA